MAFTNTKLVVQITILFMIAFSIYVKPRIFSPFIGNWIISMVIGTVICIVAFLDLSVAVLLTCLWLLFLSRHQDTSSDKTLTF